MQNKEIFQVCVSGKFAAAHYITNHNNKYNKCSKLHGHNWLVEVMVEEYRLNEDGVVMNFNVLKEELEKVLKELDHNLLNELPAFKGINPTAENIAKYIYDKLSNINITEVKVYETNSAYAVYKRV